MMKAGERGLTNQGLGIPFMASVDDNVDQVSECLLREARDFAKGLKDMFVFL